MPLFDQIMVGGVPDLAGSTQIYAPPLIIISEWSLSLRESEPIIE